MTQVKFQVKRANGTVSAEFHTLNRALWFAKLMDHSHVDYVTVPVSGFVQPRFEKAAR